MTTAVDFHYSQASLEDYLECRRRFELRYLLRQPWPAIEVEPALEHEEHLQQGEAFHRLVQGHLLGVPLERLTSQARSENLRRWWRHYLDHAPADLPAERHPEVQLSAPLAGRRLVAKLDLVACEPGKRLVIVDWKTTRRPPPRQTLTQRMQTRLYRFLLVESGAHLNGGERVKPGQVEMLYWFAEAPTSEVRLAYDERSYREDGEFLRGLVEEIEAKREGDFDLTSKTRRCRTCRYRSLCRRGEAAGDVAGPDPEAELDEGFDFELDFDQIAEIEF